MCTAIAANRRFDPRLCPLLQGLPPDEQQERMRTDPRIAACIASLGGESASNATGKRLRALSAREISCVDAAGIARSAACDYAD
jgi:hypothetical protein